MGNQAYRCVLLLSDRAAVSDPAEAFTRDRFDVQHVSRHARGETVFPNEAAEIIAAGETDFLFNHLAPMIVPASVLRWVRRASINWHPAPPRWPGVGSASYALYHNDTTFGVTAHHMTSHVDAGMIVRVRSFPIDAEDGCESLFDRAVLTSVGLFCEIVDELSRTGHVTPSGDTWERPAVTRAEFEAWMASPPRSDEDRARKVRALRHSRFLVPSWDRNTNHV